MGVFWIGFITTLLYLFFTGIFAWLALLSHATFYKLLAGLAAVIFFYLLFVRVWRMGYCALSRLRLCRKLRKFSTRNGWEIEWLHAPLISFFKSYSGADAILRTREKTVHLKFFPYTVHKKIVHIVDREHVVFSKQWALMFAPMGGRRAGMPGSGVVAEEMLPRKRVANLAFDTTEGECIWVISPNPHRMSAVAGTGHTVETVDNGYRWNGELFYDSRAVFRYLEHLL